MNTHAVNVEFFICEALCGTKQSYKHIDKIYNRDKQKYSKLAKESEYYSYASERNIEQETYFKKVLGIVQLEEDIDNLIYILKMTYKKANQVIKNSKDVVRMSKLIFSIDFEKLSFEEKSGNLLSLILIAKHEGKEIDTSDIIYEEFGKTMILRFKELHSENRFKYNNIEKTKKKRLREIQLNLCKKYPNLRNHILETDLIDIDTGKVYFDKMTKYQKMVFDIERIYTLEDLNDDSLINNKLLTDNELQELINIYGVANGPLDHVDYDKLYGFMFPAVHIRYLLKAYKNAKKYHFDTINKLDIDNLHEKEIEMRSVKQENIDLKARYDKLKSDTDKEISSLKEEIRILQNKNKKLENKISSYPNVQDELNQLRNLMFSLNEDIIEESTEVDVDKLNNINAICFGGNDNWANNMKEILPNWKFIPAGVENFDTTILKNKDYIFVNTIANSHGAYCRIIENKDSNTKIRYINSLNKDRVLYEINQSL